MGELCRIIRHLGSGIHLNSYTGWKNFIKDFRPVLVSIATPLMPKKM